MSGRIMVWAACAALCLAALRVVAVPSYLADGLTVSGAVDVIGGPIRIDGVDVASPSTSMVSKAGDTMHGDLMVSNGAMPLISVANPSGSARLDPYWYNGPAIRMRQPSHPFDLGLEFRIDSNILYRQGPSSLGTILHTGNFSSFFPLAVGNYLALTGGTVQGSVQLRAAGGGSGSLRIWSDAASDDWTISHDDGDNLLFSGPLGTYPNQRFASQQWITNLYVSKAGGLYPNPIDFGAGLNIGTGSTKAILRPDNWYGVNMISYGGLATNRIYTTADFNPFSFVTIYSAISNYWRQTILQPTNSGYAGWQGQMSVTPLSATSVLMGAYSGTNWYFWEAYTR